MIRPFFALFLESGYRLLAFRYPYSRIERSDDPFVNSDGHSSAIEHHMYYSELVSFPSRTQDELTRSGNRESN